MKESKYDKEIKVLEKQRQELNEKLAILEQAKADEVCPFSIGQDVQDKKGNRGKVVRILPSAWGDPYPMIQLCKKDGSLGKRIIKDWGWDDWH